MYRLRDLTGRQALVAAAMVVLVLVPFGASAARARHVQWLPSGDDALIGLRAHDVLTSERPLLGQPSTSHLYGPKQGTSHPGPIEFYWLAVPLRALGPSAGMIVGALAFNLASVLVAAWVVLRRAGPAVAAGAMVLLSLVLWSEGSAILSDPISSNAGGIPMLALAAIAWAVVDGDLRLLPLGAAFGSWVAQQHLAITVPAGGLVLFGIVGASVHGVGRLRRRRASVDEPDPTPDPDPGPEPRAWPWAVGALGLALVLWSPVIWQQLTGDPGNLTAVLEYSQHSGRPSLGWVSALRQGARAGGFPPLLLRSDLWGDDLFRGPIQPVEVVAALAFYAALVAVVVGAWRRRRTLALLSLTALVLAIAGVVNGSSIPDSIEAFRINFYRWAFVVAWLGWLAIGWAGTLVAARALARRERSAPAWLPRAALVAALVLMAVPALGTTFTAGFDDERRDQTGFVAMRTMRDAATAEADRVDADTVTLVLRGRSSVLAGGPAVALQLTAEGYDVVAPGVEGRFWGDARVLEPGEDPGDLILELASGRGEVVAGPGRTIARVDLNAELRDVLDPLVDTARSSDVVPSDRAEELLADAYPETGRRDYVRRALAQIDRDPQPVLTDPQILELIAAGYFDSPAFDPAQLEALAGRLPATTVNDEDVYELRVLTEADLAQVVPGWEGE